MASAERSASTAAFRGLFDSKAGMPRGFRGHSSFASAHSM